MMIRYTFTLFTLVSCLIGTPTPGGAVSPDETEAWREDLLFVQLEMPRVHPDLFHTLPQESFDASILALIERLASMTHNEIITELADYMTSIGFPIPDNFPFVGRNFNTTRAGIHAGGLRSDERIYNIFDTTKLLGRPPKVAITNNSGVDGVAHWVNEFFQLKGDDRISKIKVHKVARWVIDQYEVTGRLTAISDEEMITNVKELMPTFWAKYHGDGDAASA